MRWLTFIILLALAKVAGAAEGRIGSGFFISERGHVLTAGHVVETCREIWISGWRLSRQRAARYYDNPFSDTYVLITKPAPDRVVAIEAADADLFRRQEENGQYLVAGYGNGQYGAFPAKHHTQIVPVEKGGLADHAAFAHGIEGTFYAGMSGGPVLDGTGTALGVLIGRVEPKSGSTTEPSRWGLHTTTKFTAKYGERKGLPVLPPRSEPMPDLEGYAKKVTMKVECLE